MIKYIQLPYYFDAITMQKEVQQLNSNLWKLHYQKLHYEGNWSGIPLRSVNGNADNIIVSPVQDIEYDDTIFLEQCAYIKEVLNSFKCPLQTVRLLKLNAGAVIKEHRDIELNFEKGEIRLHIPVVTNDAVEFYLDNERITAKEGECWYMNFNLPHHIRNNSDVDRIHLVIDAKVNDWVKTVFLADDIILKKEIEDTTNERDAETKKLMIARFRDMNTDTANKLADELEEELRVQFPTLII
jgi:hypothetical protein